LGVAAGQLTTAKLTLEQLS